MRSLSLFLFVVLFVTFALTSRAYGSPKQPKPYVCMNYAIAKTAADHDDAVGICYETKKTKLFYRFEEVTIVDKAEGRRKVLLGWS